MARVVAESNPPETRTTAFFVMCKFYRVWEKLTTKAEY